MNAGGLIEDSDEPEIGTGESFVTISLYLGIKLLFLSSFTFDVGGIQNSQINVIQMVYPCFVIHVYI
jgi:hypothetical protein